MPLITLTEGPEIYYDRFRGIDIWFGINMLGGDDQLYANFSYHNLRAYLGAGNDYAQIGHLYEAAIYGEAGNDVVDVVATIGGSLIDLGDGNDRVNFLVGAPSINVSGGAGNDAFYGYKHTFTGMVQGGAGDDVFDGFGVYGGYGPTLAGGPGNDVYRIDPASPPTIVEKVGEGIDTVELLHQASYVLPANVENLVIAGAPPPSTTITGNPFDNVLTGSSSADRISGLGGNDILLGNGGNDTLLGGSGADSLRGGDGADLLRGDSGRDQMWGGTGADRFVFNDGHFGGATATTCDIIHDFSRAQGDRIQLNLVDANSGVIDDQAFAFIGTAAFSHVPGQLRYEQISGNTYVQGDLNGDAVADFWIGLDGLHSLAATDFWL